MHPRKAEMRRILPLLAVLSCVALCNVCFADSSARPLSIKQARVCITGHDVNPPDNFPGWGGFGWPGNLVQLSSGELLMAHSAGYWHVSFAEPRLIEPNTRKKWLASNWPLDFTAPNGGRSMLSRSRDNGLTWSRPETIVDLPFDDGACGLLLCRSGTLLCFVNVQSSWYGFKKAPKQFRNQLDGLNTKQCVLRSTDGGHTWEKPVWIDSPGNFYERSHSQPIELPDGGILWPTYCSDTKSKHLFGAIHRSDDRGKTWKTISTIRRKAANVDEPAIARLHDGRLILITRPDGGLFFSSDTGHTWQESERIVKTGRLKAPRLFVLADRTVVCACTFNGTLHVFLGTDDGKTWSKPISLDRSAYGYPGGVQLKDGSLLVSYCSSGKAPNRIYAVRFKVNPGKTAIELLPLGEKSRKK